MTGWVGFNGWGIKKQYEEKEDEEEEQRSKGIVEKACLSKKDGLDFRF